MYPTGSNGASQAIDGRARAGCRNARARRHRTRRCRPTTRGCAREISAVVLRNRGAGPFGLLNLLDERCGGVFDDIDAVIPAAERDAFMSRYKAAAGFAMETLNSCAADHPARRAGARRTERDAAALRLPEVSRGHDGRRTSPRFCARMLALRERIDGIQHLEIGRDELHDARSWDLVLIMTFASVEALRLYQRHPEHLAVMAFNEPFLGNVASVDFTDPAS